MLRLALLKPRATAQQPIKSAKISHREVDIKVMPSFEMVIKKS